MYSYIHVSHFLFEIAIQQVECLPIYVLLYVCLPIYKGICGYPCMWHTGPQTHTATWFVTTDTLSTHMHSMPDTSLEALNECAEKMCLLSRTKDTIYPHAFNER